MHALRLLALMVACYGIGRSTPASAQNWADAGLPGEFLDWGDYYLDTVTNSLYATGINRLYVGGPAGVYVRNGVQWDTLGLFWSAPQKVIRYNDTILVAGNFYAEFGGEPLANMAFLDSTGWHSYGTFNGSVRQMRLLDGELYVVGGFSQVDGQPSAGIAKRVGAQWVPVPGLVPVSNPPALFDVIKYQGDLVVCGNMSLQGITGLDVYVLQNGEWSALGGGLSGIASGGWGMTIYNDELILGGNFYLSAGNAGQSIMRWNGSVWQPLGVAVTDDDNSYSTAAQIHALAVRDGKLFVGGGFFYAGGVPARGISTWDGDQWCGLGSDLQKVHDIEFFNDTMWVMCNNNWVDGVYYSGGVYYLHETYDDTCSVPLGTGVELLPPASQATLAQREDVAYILGLPDGTHPYAIWDAAGRVMVSGTVTSHSGRSTPVYLDALAGGIYLVRLASPSIGTLAQRFVVQR
jgi:hypothetical protein